MTLISYMQLTYNPLRKLEISSVCVIITCSSASTQLQIEQASISYSCGLCNKVSPLLTTALNCVKKHLACSGLDESLPDCILNLVEAEPLCSFVFVLPFLALALLATCSMNIIAAMINLMVFSTFV